MKRLAAGFTFVEMLVVLAVIGILAAVIYPNFSQSSATARDAQRKADLRLVQNALETYRLKEGRYPPGCNGGSGDGWSGEQGTTYACSSGDQYIVGLAPAYIPVLPKDPKRNGANSGYVYRTNAEGTVYKFVSRNSVETETVTYTSDFAACDVLDDGFGNIFESPVAGSCQSSVLPSVTPTPEGSWCGYAVCNIYYVNPGYQRPATDCFSSNINRSYAVWGGYANPADVGGAATDEVRVERGTEQVICDMP